VLDTETSEIYTPLKLPGAHGAFVGKVKAEYENHLDTISLQCFCIDHFRSDTARRVIAHVKANYGDELEFLWPKSPKAAICRRKDTTKWYAVFANLPKTKVGLDGHDGIDIINLRTDPSVYEALVDGRRYLPPYHMGKMKSWFTICLDGSVPAEEIHERIAASYLLAVAGKKKNRRP